MRKTLQVSVAFVAVVLVLALPQMAWTQARKAPPGMFKDLDDQIVGEAMVIHGKQLFIDDYLVGELQGAKKVLNQPDLNAPADGDIREATCPDACGRFC